MKSSLLSLSLSLLLPIAQPCDLTLSRRCRKVVPDHAVKVGCPFNVQKDVALSIGKLYSKRGTVHVCELCAKTFVGHDETFIDRHVSSKHSDSINIERGERVCLADFADIIGCGKLPVAYFGIKKCSATLLRKRKFECENIVRKCGMDKQICDEIVCADGEMYRQSKLALPDKRSNVKTLVVVFFFVCAIVLSAMLVLFCLDRNTAATSPDLRRQPPQLHRVLHRILNSIFKRKKK